MTKPRPKQQCPTPRKPRFRDRIAAALFASRDAATGKGGQGHGRDHLVTPYPCPAGHWHVKSIRKPRAS